MDKSFVSRVAIMFPFSFTKISEKVLTIKFQKTLATRIIINETEVFEERATLMKTQAETWFSYKHHNTRKKYVSISLSGIAAFILSLWIGRISDKEITKCPRLLEKLEPGDNIMVNRGLNIADILPSGVTPNIPSFKGGRYQLKPKEIDETARIAAVIIHVERAIG